MKTMTKKINGVVLAVLIGFLTYGVCIADEPNGIGEPIPIAPIGIVNTAEPTYEWTAVPGATTYCLLVEDIDGVPLYLAWYTDEEAGCMNGEEFCSVTPHERVDGGAWAVLPCAAEGCGQWSTAMPFASECMGDTQRWTAMTPEECRRRCRRIQAMCNQYCDRNFPYPSQEHRECLRQCANKFAVCLRKHCRPKP